MGTSSFSGAKWPGRGVDHPLQSNAEVKESVELYLYSTSGPSWPVLWRTLPLPLPLYGHKRPSLDPTISHLNPAHTILSHLFNIQFDRILQSTPGLQIGSLTTLFMHCSFVPRLLHAPTTSSSLILPRPLILLL